jgi:hypothetical protein
MKLQLALVQSLFDLRLDPLGLSFTRAMHYDIVSITLKGITGTGFPHPFIKSIVEEEIRQQGTDNRTLRRSLVPIQQFPIFPLYRCLQPSLNV